MIPDSVQAAIASGMTRTLCPACSGGGSRELSLSIRRDGPFVSLYCFRNKCGWRHMAGVHESGASTKREREPRAYDGPMHRIGYDDDMAYCLSARYELVPEDYGPRWAEGAPGGLVMAVYGPHGQPRGHITRTFTKPKRCMTYQALLSQPWLDWWLPDACERLYLVEDSISACKIASLDQAAVALLGTQLSPAKAGEIAQVCKARKLKPILALDPDATKTAFDLVARYQHAIPGLGVMPMQDDPKDIPLDRLRFIL